MEENIYINLENRFKLYESKDAIIERQRAEISALRRTVDIQEDYIEWLTAKSREDFELKETYRNKLNEIMEVIND